MSPGPLRDLIPQLRQALLRGEEIGAEDGDLLEAFVTTSPSLSLQQTLFAMGRAALAGRPELDEVRLTLPNRHHFPVDLTPFGLQNPNEVFHAADRPYGLIEGTVRRAPDGTTQPVDESGAGLTVAERDLDW